MHRRLSIAVWLVLLLPVSALAQGVDFMNMVQQYGQNVVDTLHTEIMNDALRRSAGQATNPQLSSSRTEQWPAHITEANSGDHVFSVEELIAMRYNDEERMRAMLHGRAISVYGQVVRSDRADSSFRLRVGNDSGYHVWAYWRRWSGELPAHGSWLELRGVFEMERRSYGAIRDGEYYNVSATRQGPVPAVTDLGQSAPAAQATAASLTYSPNPDVSVAIIELVAETLAPALTGGATQADLLQALHGGELQAAWAQIMGAQGFSTTDLADAMTAHLILSWQIANNQPDVNEVAGGNLVRQAVRDALLQADWVAYADQAEIQAISELLMLSTMVITSMYIHALETGNSALLANAGEDARPLVMGHGGPDVRLFNFTAQGFVSR